MAKDCKGRDVKAGDTVTMEFHVTTTSDTVASVNPPDPFEKNLFLKAVNPIGAVAKFGGELPEIEVSSRLTDRVMYPTEIVE